MNLDYCTAESMAVRVHRRTLTMIEAINGNVMPEIEENETFFMLYCAGTDHEEAEIIDKETYDRTYGPMDSWVLAQFVKPID